MMTRRGLHACWHAAPMHTMSVIELSFQPSGMRAGLPKVGFQQVQDAVQACSCLVDGTMTRAAVQVRARNLSIYRSSIL